MVDDLDFETACNHIQTVVADFLDKAHRLAYAAGHPSQLKLKDPDTNEPLNPLKNKWERDMARAYQKVLLDAASTLLYWVDNCKSANQLETELDKVCDELEQKIKYINNLIKKGALEKQNTVVPSTKTKKACQSALYATRTIEPRPNHAAVSDLLRILPYPHKWKDYGIELGAAQIIHSKERYVQYELFGMDSTGDFIPITPESTQDIVSSFDWIDHKILSALLMRSFESGGEKFVLSLNWLANLITDNRDKQLPDNSGKRKYLSHKALLEDLERRLKRIRMLFIQVKWHEGESKNKKVYNLLMQEGIQRIEFALFLIPSIWEEKSAKKHDIFAEVEPGRWYQLFCKNLRQFTWIPKELFGVNTHNNWRRYALGEYTLMEYRNNVDDLKEVTDDETKQPIKVLYRKLDTLIRELLTPEEVNYALTNRDKGWRLKKAILDDFEYYRSCGWYVGLQFPEGGFQEFLAGVVKIAPAPANAQAIQKAVDSHPKPKKPPSRRKPKELTGEQIRNARLAKGWTQRELVKALDAYVEVSQRKISFWESGKTQPTPQEAAKLRHVLDIKD